MEMIAQDASGASRAVKPSRRRRAGISTKRKLALCAVALGAKHDFSLLPLRNIVGSAACGNISAVHYHFRNRDGLQRYILRMINRSWPVEISNEVRDSVRGVLTQFLLNLEVLKRAEDWQDSVVSFLVRLAHNEEMLCSDEALELLAMRLKVVFDAIKPHCPDVDDRVLRLRVSSACLLLLGFSAKMNNTYLAALEARDAFRGVSDQLVYCVDMACGLVSGERESGSLDV